uniref:Cytochrome P450 93A3-like n=1 Tax=Tanacetum cinerariifolium TaxID=118510 RepID=A0A6L2JX77_TANCI|nr:cytochrome P450 93A3-like [Tanacetum cinerariifolium]
MVDFQSCSFLLFICIISTILVCARFFKSSGDKSRHPPTPFGLPIIGHLYLLNPNPARAFHRLSLLHGPIFRVFLGSVPCVIACSPEIAYEFLKINEEAFSNRSLSSSQHYITYGSKDFVFAPYGPYWKFMKKIVMSQLLNGKTLDLLSSVRHDEIKCFIDSLSEKAKIGKSVDLSEEFMKLTNNVISRMIMSKRCTDEDGEIGEMISDITMTIGSFNLSDYVWLLKTLDVQGLVRKVKDARLRYDLLIDRVLEEHDKARKHEKIGQAAKDLLDILLDIEKDESSEIKLSRENIKAFVLDLIVAGTDTTATTMEWAMAELINHPNIMKKAAQQIHQVVGENRLIQESDIPKLPGRRMCPGISLAQHIVHTSLGAMIQCFEWKAGKDGNLSSVDMEERSGLSVPRANPLHYITYGSKDFVFAPYGPYWKFMKKIVMSQLLNGKTLDLLSSVRHDEIKCFIDSLSEKAKIGKKVKDARLRYDLIIDRVLEEHDKARKHEKIGQAAKDLLDILLDIEKDESSEIKLSRENIKAFVLVTFS